MATHTLFEKTAVFQKELNWADLFSGIKEKHNSEDLENTLLSGTAIDRAADEKAMLLKWKAPWVFLRALIVGAVLSVLFFILAGSFGHPAFIMMAMLFPAFVVPMALLVFFWEMNAPRNISFFQLILCFALGGIFSLVATMLFDMIGVTPTTAVAAPLTEEPGKFVIVLFLMHAFSRKKDFKIYGMTGMAMGAAVGAGFAAFESAYYVFGYTMGDMLTLFTAKLSDVTIFYAGKSVTDIFFGETFNPATETFYLLTFRRIISAFASHVLYCVPYSTAAALAMKDNRFSMTSLLHPRFLGMFAASCVFHAANNWNWPSISSYYICYAIRLVLEWWLVLLLIRSCFKQLGDKMSHRKRIINLDLKCISGAHAGRMFAITHDSVVIGTGDTSNLVYPFGTKGISEKHCKLVVQNGGLYLADAASAGGTYLNGTRLKAGVGHPLKEGDCFWLGSENEKFVVVPSRT